MSTLINSPDSSPIQPLHHSSLVVPQAPIGNGSIINQAPGMGAKALLAKKPTKPILSPTDQLLTPCTARLRKMREKHFKPTKPVQLFFQKENVESSEVHIPEQVSGPTENKIEADDENAFPQENVESREEHISEQVSVPTENKMEVDDENPL